MKTRPIDYSAAITTNKAATAPSKGSITTLSATVEKASVRYEKLEGKQHLVVPFVSLTEGVHSGSKGAIRYTKEELSKTPQTWNAKPVVVHHPVVNGKGVSACDPLVFNTSRIGLIMNSSSDEAKLPNGKTGARLKGEAWIDVDKSNKIDDRIVKNVEEGKVTELSTGLFSDDEPAEEGATFNGEAYIATALNIRPDHLAILPDAVGACSIEKGAGLMRNVSHEDLKAGVQKALNDKHGKYEASIESMHDGAVIHRAPGSYGNDKLMHQKYSADDKGAVTLEGDPKPVTRKTSYLDTKGKVVANAATDSTELDAWGDSQADTESLADVTETQEAAFEKAAKNPVVKKQAVTKTTQYADLLKKPVAGGEPAPTPGTTNKKEKDMNRAAMIESLKLNDEVDVTQDTDEELEQEGNKTGVSKDGKRMPPKKKTPEDVAAGTLNSAPELSREDREALEFGKRQIAQNRANLCATITGNKRNTFTPTQLAAKPFAELQALAELATPEPTANYGGLGETFAPTTNELVANKAFALPVPKMDFTKP